MLCDLFQCGISIGVQRQRKLSKELCDENRKRQADRKTDRERGTRKKKRFKSSLNVP